MATKKTDPTGDSSSEETTGSQTGPPEIDPTTVEGGTLPESNDKKGGGGKKFIEFDAAEAIYNQLVMTRKTLDTLVDEAKEAKVSQQLSLLPVHVSDLMRGFQDLPGQARDRSGAKG